MPSKQLENEFNILNNRIFKIEKWSRFKQERTKVIVNFIEIKKKIYHMHILFTLMRLSRYINLVSSRVARRKSKRFVGVIISRRWFVRLRKFGKDINDIFWN